MLQFRYSAGRSEVHTITTANPGLFQSGSTWASRICHRGLPEPILHGWADARAHAPGGPLHCAMVKLPRCLGKLTAQELF